MCLEFSICPHKKTYNGPIYGMVDRATTRGGSISGSATRSDDSTVLPKTYPHNPSRSSSQSSEYEQTQEAQRIKNSVEERPSQSAMYNDSHRCHSALDDPPSSPTDTDAEVAFLCEGPVASAPTRSRKQKHLMEQAHNFFQSLPDMAKRTLRRFRTLGRQLAP